MAINATPFPEKRAPPCTCLAGGERIVAAWNDTLRAELATVEQALMIKTSRATVRERQVMLERHQRQITQALGALPHAVIRMSADIPTLVETSANVAVVATEGNTVSVATSQRSSVGSEIDEIVDTVSTISEPRWSLRRVQRRVSRLEAEP